MPDKIKSKEGDQEAPILHVLPPNPSVRFTDRHRGFLGPKCRKTEFYILPGADVIRLSEVRKSYGRLFDPKKVETGQYKKNISQLLQVNLPVRLAQALAAYHAFNREDISKDIIRPLYAKGRFDESDDNEPDPINTNGLNANQGGIAA